MRTLATSRSTRSAERSTLARGLAAAKLLLACLLALVLAFATVEVYLRLTQERQFETVDEALEFIETLEPDATAGTDMPMKGLIRASSNRELIFELKPNLRTVYKGAPLETNSVGFRDREWTLEKPAGTLRIAAIGDSVLFGPYVPVEEIYLRLLEGALQAQLGTQPGARRVETLNFGVPGYNSFQEAVVVRDTALRYAPDVLLLNYCENDDGLPNFIADILDQDGGLLPRSQILRKFATLSQDEQQELGAESPASTGAAAGDGLPEEYRRMCGWPAIEAAMRSIAALARERGVKLLMVLYASRAGPDNDPNPLAERHAAIARVAQELGIELLDLHPAFTRLARERGWRDIVPLWAGPHNGHLNAEGHRAYAQELEKKLDELGWLRAE